MKMLFEKTKQILERDWLDDIKNFYLSINPVYRHSFWILFIITNIVFGFHTINFFWGNHDWELLVKGASIKYAWYEGRYAGFAISQLLTGNLYLPIITALWAFAALSLSAVLLAIYWKIPKKTSYFVILGLIMNITPYTCAWFFYAHWTVNIIFCRLFVISGLLIATYHISGTKKQKILGNIFAIFLLNFGLGIYQSSIQTIITVLLGRILIEMLDWTSFKTGIKTIFTYIFIVVIDVIIAFLVYEIIYHYMKYVGLISPGFYNLEVTPLEAMPNKIILCIKIAWQQFTDWQMPFYPNFLTKLFNILAVIFVIQIIVSRKSSVMKICILTTFILSLFLTKTVAFVASEDVFYAARVDFFGYVLFNTLIIALSLKLGDVLQNIKILISCAIIYLFAINSLWYQRTFMMGFDAEKQIWQRMMARLAELPNFSIEQKYQIIQLGSNVSARLKFYPEQQNMYKDINLLTFSLDGHASMFHANNFYNFDFIKRFYRYNSFTNSEFMSALKLLYFAGLLENAKAWPAQNSIIVYEDIILVITDEKDLQKAKQLLTEQYKNEKALRDKIKAKSKPSSSSQPKPEEAK